MLPLRFLRAVRTAPVACAGSRWFLGSLLLLAALTSCTPADEAKLKQAVLTLYAAVIFFGVYTVVFAGLWLWHVVLTVSLFGLPNSAGFLRLATGFRSLALVGALGSLLLAAAFHPLLAVLLVGPVIALCYGELSAWTHRRLSAQPGDGTAARPVASNVTAIVLPPLALLLLWSFDYAMKSSAQAQAEQASIRAQQEEALLRAKLEQQVAAETKILKQASDAAETRARKRQQQQVACEAWAVQLLGPVASPDWQSSYFASDEENAQATRITTAQLRPDDVGPKDLRLVCSRDEEGRTLETRPMVEKGYARALFSPRLWTLQTSPSPLSIELLDRYSNSYLDEKARLIKHLDKLAATAKTPEQQRQALPLCRVVQALHRGVVFWPRDLTGACKRLAQQVPSR